MLPEQIDWVRSELKTNYADLFRQHASLSEQIGERLADRQHQARLSLLQQNPFLESEEHLHKQQQIWQAKERSFSPEDVTEYKLFCQQAGIAFDGKFWYNELNPKNKKGKSNDKKHLSWQLMLNKWQQQIDEAKAQWYLDSLHRLRQEWLKELSAWLEIVRQLHQQLAQLGLDAGLWLDNSIGKLTPQSIEILKRWLNYLSEDEGACQIADLLGKMRQIEQSKKLEEVQQPLPTQAVAIDINSNEEIIGLRLGKELEYILPSELALMSDIQTDTLFDLKFLENKLVCFELQGTIYQDEIIETTIEKEVHKDEKLGPMILCVDTSGSMQGTPEHIAKAMALFLATKAKQQNRSCFIINFSTKIDIFEITKQTGIEKLIGFLRQSFHGGTDAAPALQYVLKLMQQEQYEKADVLIISDFIMGNLPENILSTIQEQRQAGNKFNSLIIGNHFLDNRLKTHFDHEWLYNPHSKNIHELVRFQQDIS